MDNFKNIYTNKRVLVTGHTGFKGTWLSLWLTALNAKVIGYSLKPPTEPNMFSAVGLKSKISHITGDIRDDKKLYSVFKKYKPEIVFHLAAQPLVRLSYDSPKYTYETNVIGTLNVLECVKRTPSVKACIIITTDKCYENKEKDYAYRETDPLGGYDPYSSSKACAELVVSSWRNSFFNHGKSGSPAAAVSSVRAGNVIGGGDWGIDRLVPDCIKSLSENKPVILRNPDSIRPWQYVLEPLSGYLLLGSKMLQDRAKYSTAVNFGPLKKNIITVKQLTELMINNWGTGKYQIDRSAHPHEAKLLALNIDKSYKLLGWKPKYGIKETIKRTVNWYKNYYTRGLENSPYKLSIMEIKDYMKQ